jgi:hypothetical protein
MTFNTFWCAVCEQIRSKKGSRKVRHKKYPDQPLFACASCLDNMPEQYEYTNR